MNTVSAPGVPSIDRLQLLVRPLSITASMWIFTLTWFLPQSSNDHGLQCIAPNSHNDGLQVHLQTSSIIASQCISKHVRLQPPSSHHHGFQVHISKLAQSWPLRVSPNLLNHVPGVYLWVHPLELSGAHWIALKHFVKPVRIYCV